MMKVHNIPSCVVTKYLALFPNDPIVSVGCGNGTIEYQLKKNGVQNLILVDPDPESFEEYPQDGYLNPDFATVQDLIQVRPELVENCVLFLCWPCPMNSHYDAEAICLLKPKAVVLLYETKGAAGGGSLHHWLHKIGAKDSGTIYESKYYPSTDYLAIRSYTQRIRGTFDMLVNSLVLIVKKDLELPQGVEQIKDVSLYPPGYDPHRDGGDNDVCVMM